MIRAFISIGWLISITAAIAWTAILAADHISWVGKNAALVSRLGALCLLVALYLLIGLSSFRSPWRMLWRRFPQLNRWVFPDLNGLWLGTAKSNWPRVQARSDAWKFGAGTEPQDIASIPLGENAVAMQIEANWFNITMRARLQSANAESRAVALQPHRKFNGWRFALAYVYRQNSSAVAATDEETHDGAACVELVAGKEMLIRGPYWTKRNWHQALNTAGELMLKKVSDKHVSDSEDILEAAKNAAAQQS